MRARRPGFTIIELLVVVLMLGVLAAIAVPGYQKVVYRARAARIINDLRVVRTAAYQYQLDHDRWPPDGNRGEKPAPFAPYLEAVDFIGDGYVLDWDNWDPVFGIAVIVEDPLLEGALASTLDQAEGTFMRMGDRYTYFVESELEP